MKLMFYMGNDRVDPNRYVDFDLNPDLELASEVATLLQEAGFDAALEPKFEQIHDTLWVHSQNLSRRRKLMLLV